MIKNLYTTAMAIEKIKTHKCANRAFAYAKKVENKYVVNIDFSKYFYSIHNVTLKEELMKSIQNKYILNLLFDLIDSFKTKNYFDDILKNHSIYVDTYKKGMPIGSLVSQYLQIYI